MKIRWKIETENLGLDCSDHPAIWHVCWQCHLWNLSYNTRWKWNINVRSFLYGIQLRQAEDFGNNASWDELLLTEAFPAWAPFQYKDGLSSYGSPMLKIRRSWDHLTFNMGIPILVRWHLYIETAPLELVPGCLAPNGLSNEPRKIKYFIWYRLLIFKLNFFPYTPKLIHIQRTVAYE